MPVSSALLCSKCNNLLRDPRTTPCAHFFCSECLKEELLQQFEETAEQQKQTQSADSEGAAAARVLFRCPKTDCGQQHSISILTLDAFPLVVALLPLLEKETRRQSRTVCSLHKKCCKFFCKKCSRELCKKCVKEHDGHSLMETKDANREFVEKCRKKGRDRKEVRKSRRSHCGSRTRTESRGT